VAWWSPTPVPKGHRDAAPHDGSAAVRHRVGARPPPGLEAPCGGAIRGQTKLQEMCEARGPTSETICTCARSSTGGRPRPFTRARIRCRPCLHPLTGRRAAVPLPSPLTRRREEEREREVVGDGRRYFWKPEGFSAKPSSYRRSRPFMRANRRPKIDGDVATLPGLGIGQES
jgi:hypothetical protein